VPQHGIGRNTVRSPRSQDQRYDTELTSQSSDGARQFKVQAHLLLLQISVMVRSGSTSVNTFLRTGSGGPDLVCVTSGALLTK
jgi:hypothetical protein